MLAAARWNKRARVAAVGLVAGAAIATISACTTGDVFALQPAVDVGSQTAAVPQPDAPQYSGMQRLVPSDPYMTQAAYPRMDEPMSPLEQMPASEID
ncbi:extensin, partial [Mesorhizobium sp. M4B.F.Ca.ET.169.01.1.1]